MFQNLNLNYITNYTPTLHRWTFESGRASKMPFWYNWFTGNVALKHWTGRHLDVRFIMFKGV
jgi:hypothetical protein